MPDDPELFYFGCIGGPGHYLWRAINGTYYQHVRDNPLPLSEDGLDGRFCPGYDHKRERCPDQQPEGNARLSWPQGCTVLAFWDRSVDERYGCNSAFLCRGTLTLDYLLQLAEQQFPHVMRRLNFPITLVEMGAASEVAAKG